MAVVAVVLGAGMMARRAGDRKARASHHSLVEVELRSQLADFRIGRALLRDGLTPAAAEALGARIEAAISYHAALFRKYERAARYPWLPVAPDPPPPD